MITRRASLRWLRRSGLPLLVGLVPWAATAAAFVGESPVEFHAAADVDGDGRPDVVVVDKTTGKARVGLQKAAGLLTWIEPRVTGVENVTGCALGRLLAAGQDALAVTAPGRNQVHLIDLSDAVAPGPPRVLIPEGIGPGALAVLARPVVPPVSPDPALFIASDANGADAHGVELMSALGTPLLTSLFPESGPFERANALELSANGPSFAVGLVREATNDALRIWSFTNSPGAIGTLRPLPMGSEYVFGRFNAEVLPRFGRYVPGQSNVVVHALLASGSGLAFGAPLSLNVTSAIERVHYLPEGTGTNGSLLLQFADGVQAVRLSNDTLRAAARIGAEAGTHFTGVTALGDGRFALLSAPTGAVETSVARVMRYDGTNFTGISTSSLPTLRSRLTTANVWLFDTNPFTNNAAVWVASLAAPDWSIGVSGLPLAVSVQAERDAGVSSGLGGGAVTNLGAAPLGTRYGLANQYHDAISVFSFAPPRTPGGVTVAVAPPPGRYDGRVAIRFTVEPAGGIYYRLAGGGDWEAYDGAAITLERDTTVEYYGASLGGRSPIQSAAYQLGRTGKTAPAPVVLPDAELADPPPPFNPTGPAPPSPGTVYFTRVQDARSTIWRIRLDGTDEALVADGRLPRVSPDGLRLALLRSGAVGAAQDNLWIRDLMSGEERLMFAGVDGIRGLDWSAARELIFNHGCHLLRLDESGAVVGLPDSLLPDCVLAPAVNRVDSRIAYERSDDVTAAVVEVTPPDWSYGEALSLSSLSEWRWPAWSPEGSRLAVTEHSPDQLPGKVGLWVVDVECDLPMRVGEISRGPSPQGGVTAWMPDGSALVTAGSIDGTNGLWVIPIEVTAGAGTGPRLLATSMDASIDAVGSVSAEFTPTLGPARLDIRRSGDITIVYWRTNLAGYGLEASTDLSVRDWVSVDGPFARAGSYFEYRPAGPLAARTFFRLRYPGTVLVAPEWAPLPPPPTNTVIQGTLRFSNTNPAILDLLNAPGDEGMRSSFVAAVARPPAAPITATTPEITAASRLGTPYRVTVTGNDQGIGYVVTPRVSLLNNAESYYFNSRTSALVTVEGPPVTLDFVECVGVITVRFVDSAGRPATVDGGQILVTGAASRRATIPSGASQARIYLRGGATHPMSITVNRGTDAYRDRLTFVLNTNVAVGCDAFASVDMLVPESGALGRIEGRVDMLGEFELTVDTAPTANQPDYTGVIANNGPFSNHRWATVAGANFTAPASGSFVLSNVAPSTTSASSPGYTVYAQMFLRTNRALEYFRTPALGAGSNAPLPVAGGQTINLSNLFVIDPGYLRGRVTLQGPPETPGTESLLRGINRASDNDVNGDGVPDQLGTVGLYWTSIAAEGVNRCAPGATFTTAFGYGGAIFDGAVQGGAGAFEGNYELVLGGLGSQPGLWNLKYLNLILSHPAGLSASNYYSANLTITNRRNDEILVSTDQIVSRDVGYCFGEVRLVIQSTAGPFYSPEVRASTGGFVGTDFRGQPADYGVTLTSAAGTPNRATAAGTRGEVVMYLPQGTYRLFPSVIYAGSSQGRTGLTPIDVTVGCQERIVLGDGPALSPAGTSLRVQPVSVVAAGGRLDLIFQTAAGRRYQVERTTRLEEPVWVAVGAPLMGTGGLATVSDPIRADYPQAFYRIRVEEE